ncbi:MAG: nucleotidyltransferase family protein [Longimicrobiales bacterium]
MAGRSLDWSALLTFAAKLWVHPLVARWILEPSGSIGAFAPSEARKAFGLSTLAARARWTEYEQGLAAVLRSWSAAGVEPVFLKGAAHGLTLYPFGTRFLNDLDVWVEPTRFEEAARVLVAEGFQRWSVEGGNAEDNRRRLNGWTFSREGVGGVRRLVVDLHYRLHPEGSPFALDAASCASEGGGLSFGGIPVRAFRPEDAVVHHATQMATDFTVKLQTVADLAALLGPRVVDAPHAAASTPWNQAFDFERLERRALEARAAGPVALALRWAEAIGCEVPLATIARLERAAPGSSVATAVLLDLRALHPGFRLTGPASLALSAWYRPPGRARWSALRAVPSVVARRQRRGGHSTSVRALRIVRSIPLAAFAVSAAHASALSARFSARGPVLLNRLLWWRARAPSGEPDPPVARIDG